jgi:hypothetical protein
VYATEAYGHIGFTAPRFDEYLRRQLPYRQIARPFEWTFTRQDLDALLARIDRHEPHLALAA